MRKSKQVILEGLEPITVKEMTVAHLPVVLKVLKQVPITGDLDISAASDLVLEHFGALVEVLSDCSGLEVRQLNEIGGSDLVEIIQGWLEANEGFFESVRRRLNPAASP